MMIDGYDITSFGCTLIGGSSFDSFGSLLKYPKRAEVDYNDWAEKNGIQPDLSETTFEERKIQLYFGMLAGMVSVMTDRYEDFYGLLSDTGYRTVNAVPGLTHRLRYSEMSEFSMSKALLSSDNHRVLTVEFTEDTWSQTATPPYSAAAPSGLMAINSIDFGNFGIGSDDLLDDFFKYPALKTPFDDGRQKHLDLVRTQQKNIKLNLWMLADSQAQFVNNYLAFFNELKKTGLQTLRIVPAGRDVGIYYSDCGSFKMERWSVNKVCARFSIELVAPVFGI
ncbi:MAG: hypothetical protein LBB90_10465 [Tannerella sp.]|jgi:hypothetical protein|nr:hypothetical protein [Tannerella sp.]